MKNSAKLSQKNELVADMVSLSNQKLSLFPSRVVVKQERYEAESANWLSFLKMLEQVVDSLNAVALGKQHQAEEIRKYAEHRMLSAEADEYTDDSEYYEAPADEKELSPEAYEDNYDFSVRENVAPIFIEEEYNEKYFEPWW